eukprot:2151382-Prymnesium_polylepis.3
MCAAREVRERCARGAREVLESIWNGSLLRQDIDNSKEKDPFQMEVRERCARGAREVRERSREVPRNVGCLELLVPKGAALSRCNLTRIGLSINTEKGSNEKLIRFGMGAGARPIVHAAEFFV